MRPRGRPRTLAGERRYPNRLRELRERLGLSQEQVAGQAGISIAYYGALERGDKRINADTAQRLHLPLRCAVGDLLPGTHGISLPLRIAIAAAESEERPPDYDLPQPYEWLHLRRLANSEECFGAEIFDDSADLDFSRGTILCLRAFADPPPALRLGMKLVVRFVLNDAGRDDGGGLNEAGLNDAGAPQTHEVLYGILDRNIVGDLLLVTRSRNRLVPQNALIQPGEQRRSGLAERQLLMSPREGVIDYHRRADDPGQILGAVVYSMAPE